MKATLKVWRGNDAKAGISPIPVYYNTGTFVVDKSNVDLLLGGAVARG